MDTSPERSARRPLDAVALARVSRRLNRAPEPPWLHGEVARRMVERLPIVKLRPGRVVDWGSFLGASQGLLRATYPDAALLAVEPDLERREATAAAMALPWWSPRRWAQAPAAVASDSELDGEQGQLLWSNMGLHGASDPQAVMARWHRLLAVDGFVMFSTLGPGTLTALSGLYANAGWRSPFAPFVDMHDLGDMLLHAGFADPVMDQEQLTLTWASPQALLGELRTLGGNVALHRNAGLRTAAWRTDLLGRLGSLADAGGRIALGFEIVYGHAFKPLPRAKVASETAVPLADLRAMVRATRGRS